MGNIRPCEAFRLIAREQKYVMDYNRVYCRWFLGRFWLVSLVVVGGFGSFWLVPCF